MGVVKPTRSHFFDVLNFERRRSSPVGSSFLPEVLISPILSVSLVCICAPTLITRTSMLLGFFIVSRSFENSRCKKSRLTYPESTSMHSLFFIRFVRDSIGVTMGTASHSALTTTAARSSRTTSVRGCKCKDLRIGRFTFVKGGTICPRRRISRITTFDCEGQKSPLMRSHKLHELLKVPSSRKIRSKALVTKANPKTYPIADAFSHYTYLTMDVNVIEALRICEVLCGEVTAYRAPHFATLRETYVASVSRALCLTSVADFHRIPRPCPLCV